MDVLAVCVRGNDKSVPPLCPAHSQLIADTVRLLRGNLARIEGLPYLIAQHIIFFFLFPPRHGGIAGFCQKELVRHGGRITFISGDILDVYKRQTYGMDLFARSVLQRLYSLKSEVMAGLSHLSLIHIFNTVCSENSRCSRG